MLRPTLGVTLLEDRSNPAWISIGISVGTNLVIGPIDPVSPPPPPPPANSGGTGGGIVLLPPPPVSPPVTGA